MRPSSIAVLAALLAASSARADEGAPKVERTRTDRLAVLPIVLEGGKGAATLSSIFDAVASGAELRLGLRVISYEEMFVATEEGLGDRVRDCGSDPRCIAARLRTFNARFGLVVVLDLGSKPALINLQLLDTDDGRMVESLVGELTQGSLAEAIRERTRELLERAGYVRAGRIVVDVSPPNARLTVGDGLEADPGSPSVFTVAPGTYAVSASLDGWQGAASSAVVLGGQETKVKVALSRESSVLSSPWLWVGVGAAVVAGTTAVLIATHKTTRCFCATINGVGCEPCQE